MTHLPVPLLDIRECLDPSEIKHKQNCRCVVAHLATRHHDLDQERRCKCTCVLARHAVLTNQDPLTESECLRATAVGAGSRGGGDLGEAGRTARCHCHVGRGGDGGGLHWVGENERERTNTRGSIFTNSCWPPRSHILNVISAFRMATVFSIKLTPGHAGQSVRCMPFTTGMRQISKSEENHGEIFNTQ